MFSGILSMVLPLAHDAVKFGLAEVEKRADFKNLQIVLREQLLREVRLNLEILKELGIDHTKSVMLLRTEVMQQICEQPLPVSLLFNGAVSQEVRSTILGKGGQRASYARWISGVKTESDLIERIWFRVAVAKLRAENNSDMGDVAYIKRLLMGLECSLRIRSK